MERPFDTVLRETLREERGDRAKSGMELLRGTVGVSGSMTLNLVLEDPDLTVLMEDELLTDELLEDLWLETREPETEEALEGRE